MTRHPLRHGELFHARGGVGFGSPSHLQSPLDIALRDCHRFVEISRLHNLALDRRRLVGFQIRLGKRRSALIHDDRRAELDGFFLGRGGRDCYRIP